MKEVFRSSSPSLSVALLNVHQDSNYITKMRRIVGTAKFLQGSLDEKQVSSLFPDIVSLTNFSVDQTTRLPSRASNRVPKERRVRQREASLCPHRAPDRRASPGQKDETRMGGAEIFLGLPRPPAERISDSHIPLDPADSSEDQQAVER
jgi:hypothetical protein